VCRNKRLTIFKISQNESVNQILLTCWSTLPWCQF
jgi:hypothetical protein